MKINDTAANTARAAHDVGLAAWLGGSMFGKFAHNPSLVRISDHAERGAVANTAWNGYNAINTLGLGAAAAGWAAARFTETRPAKLRGTERQLSQAKDALMAAAVITGALTGVQGACLAAQAPEGRVPVETGTRPAPETPVKAARIQRTIGVLSNVNILSGVALVAVNGVIAQIGHSHPAPQRVVSAGPASGPLSPLWSGVLAAAGVAAADQGRRALR